MMIMGDKDMANGDDDGLAPFITFFALAKCALRRWSYPYLHA